MEKRKKWQKPELAVLARSKRKEMAGANRSGDAKYCLGPLPPHSIGPARSGDAKYYLGPAPTPYYVGPARSGGAQYSLGPAPIGHSIGPI